MNKKTILIVDDTFENLYLLRVILEEAGHEVIDANNGSEGLKKLYENSTVDLIISDILMPIMDGFMFCQACKNEKLFEKIPFVFYTSTYTEKLDEEFALKLGAIQFLRKPIDHDELIFTVNNIFSKAKTPVKYIKRSRIKNEDVFKLYSERLINKLEQKSLDLGNEVLERKKAEQLLIHKNEILDLIAVSTPLHKIFDQLLLNYESVHPEYLGAISLLADDGIHLSVASAPSMPEAYNLAIQNVIIGNNVGSCGTAAYTKQPVIVSDISTDKLWADYKDLALKHNLKSCWSLPIFSKNNDVLGTFAIYSATINTPSVDEINELNLAVNLVNIAIEKSRIVAEIKKKDESYRSLIDQASDAIVTYSLDGTIHDFNKATYSILGYTKEEFLKFKIQDIVKGAIIINPKRHEKLLQGKPIIFDRQLICKNRSLIDVEISAKLQTDGKILTIVRDITMRKKAELELKRAKEYSESLIESLHEGLIVYNKHTDIISVNASFCKMSGFSETELIGQKHPYPFCPPEIEEESKLRHTKAQQGERLKNFESIYMRKDGKRFNVDVMVSYIDDYEPNTGLYFGTIIDTTERRKAELQLKESEFNLKQSQIVANIGSYSFDLNAMIWTSSDVLDKLAGIKKSYVRDLNGWINLIHPDDKEHILNYFENNILKNHENFSKEYRLVKADNNKVLWVHGLGELVFDSQGNLIKMIGTIQDITNQKQIELTLQENEASLIEAQKIAKIGSFNLDLKTQKIYSSSTFKEILEIDDKYEFTADKWKSLIYKEDVSRNIEMFQECRETGDKFDMEFRILTKNKKVLKWIHGLGEITFINGEATNFFGTAQDITESKQNEIALKTAKEFTDKLIMSMQEGLLIVDLNGKITMVNDATCKILGYTNNELVGLNLPYPFAKLEDFEEIGKTNNQIAHGEVPPFQFEFIKKNGEKFLASFSTGNIKNDKGEVIALFGTMKDISEEEKAKKLLEDIAYKSTQKKNVILELSALVGTDYQKSLREITALSATTLDVARVGVWKFNTDRTRITCENLYALKTDAWEDGFILDRKDNPNYFDALAYNQTISVEDALNNDITKKFTKDYLIPFGISSMLDVFIQGDQGMYGVICFEHTGHKRQWSADDEEFATSIASIVSLMVESSERKIAESELKAAKEFSENLILNLNEGLSVINNVGLQIEANPALCEMVGYTKEELLGQMPPFKYWPPEEYDTIKNTLSNTLRGVYSQLELIFKRKNGERFPVLLATSAVKNNNGKIIANFATIQDISERVRAQKLLESTAKKSVERKNVIIELAGLVGYDLDESLSQITSMAAKTLNVERVSVWKSNEDKSENHCKILYELKTDTFSSGFIIHRKDHLKYFKYLEENSFVSINNAVKNTLTKSMAKDYFLPNNITSKISIVVNGLDGLYGVICFEHVGKSKDWDSDEEEFAISIANVVSLMIESNERKFAENQIAMTNEQLLNANKELNVLRNQLEQENVYLRNELDLVFNYEDMVYGSAEFSNVLSEVEKVAPTNATVLLLGESGTGKELLARAVHNTSLRNNKPLIKVNCSAIPRELIESELFGHKKGSFTGAFADKIGKFELADEGTLFLDEIGELPLDMQPKILRFLQEGEIEIVGGTQLKKLNVRVIAATNRNLKEEIEKKRFREDLFFRLNVFPIVVPPLRQRIDDIPLLVEHFVDKFNKAYDKNIIYISDDAMNQLKCYSWPGNIRELENLIERALILSNSTTLVIPGFETSIQQAKQLINHKDSTLETAQRNHILQILEQCHWKISGKDGASEVLDLKPSTLRDKMAKLDLKKPNK